jgi:hypothetical protein
MYEMYDSPSDYPLPSRRARRAADAALRADVRRRNRIDRYARSALTPPPPGGMIGRILAVVHRQAHA